MASGAVEVVAKTLQALTRRVPEGVSKAQPWRAKFPLGGGAKLGRSLDTPPQLTLFQALGNTVFGNNSKPVKPSTQTA